MLSIVAVLGAGAWAGLAATRGFLFMHLLFMDTQAVFIQVLIALSAAIVLLYEMFSGANQHVEGAEPLAGSRSQLAHRVVRAAGSHDTGPVPDDRFGQYAQYLPEHRTGFHLFLPANGPRC